MAGKNMGLMEAIQIAMEAEKKANKFYADSAQKVASEQGKNLLKQLADFEQNHYNKLNELKASLEKEGKFIKYEGTNFKPFKIEVAIEGSGKIEPNKDDVLDILGIAIEAESKAHQHYKKMAKETKDKDGKEMFEKLADEETMHRRILSDEFYQIANSGGMWIWGE
jgi:rubrerythrin